MAGSGRVVEGFRKGNEGIYDDREMRISKRNDTDAIAIQADSG